MNYLFQHPDQKYPDVALPGCKACEGDQRAMATLQERGHRNIGDRVTITWVTSAQTDGDWLVDVTMTENPVRVVDNQGAPVKVRKAGRGIQQPQLRWAGTGWRIVEIRGQVL